MTRALMGERWRLCSSPIPGFSLAKRSSINGSFSQQQLVHQGKAAIGVP